MNLSRNKRLSVLFLALVFSLVSSAFAGDNPWLPVSPEEIAMKTPKVQPDADVEAIFWEVRIDDSSSDNLSLKNYVRVKIFNERGREKYAKMDIPYVKGESKLKDIAARVIRADGTIVELTEKDIFDRELVKANGVKVKSKSFAVPNIEPGVIVEYRYTEVLEDAGASGMSLDFQRDVPVQSLRYYYKPFNGKEPNFRPYNLENVRFLKADKGFYLAERSNVPAFVAEPQMPPEKTVRPWVKLQSVRLTVTNESAFSVQYTIKDPNNMSSYWGSVATENAFFPAFMNKPDKDLTKVAQEIVAGSTTDEDKLRKLYTYCQKQIKNTTFDTAPVDENAKTPKINKIGDVVKNKQAASQYIDMLFGALANSLGYESRVAMLADRSKMIFDPRMTNESFVHLGAVAVKVGENWKFFNPGVPFLPYGVLVWNEEDVWSLLVGEKFNGWEKSPLTGHDKSVARRTGRLELKDDGTLEGVLKLEYSGQSALSRRLDIYSDSPAKREEDFIADVKRRIPTAEVSAVTIDNIMDGDKPLVYQYKIRVPNYAEKTGKRLFIKPSFFEYGEPAVFSAANRKYDIYFNYPWSEKDDIEIKLPTGFGLDSADAPSDVEDPSKVTSLKITIAKDKDETMLIYRRQFYFGGGNNYMFSSKVYQPLKELFDMFQKSDSHVITLKQK